MICPLLFMYHFISNGTIGVGHILNMEDQNMLFTCLLTLFSGISTDIDRLIALLSKGTNTVFLSVALGF